MSIQYTVTGFEPTTFGMWVSSHNQETRAPAQINNSFITQNIILLCNSKSEDIQEEYADRCILTLRNQRVQHLRVERQCHERQ